MKKNLRFDGEKKSTFYKSNMNKMSIQFYILKTHQLYHLCLWTMLQHVKVGHIALSQMVISIFGLKRGHLIYLGPYILLSRSKLIFFLIILY